MTATILKPFGRTPPTGEPVKSVVEMLRKLADEAERGEIVGFSGVVIDPNGFSQSVISDGTASCFTMLAGLRLLERDFIERFWPK